MIRTQVPNTTCSTDNNIIIFGRYSNNTYELVVIGVVKPLV